MKSSLLQLAYELQGGNYVYVRYYGCAMKMEALEDSHYYISDNPKLIASQLIVEAVL